MKKSFPANFPAKTPANIKGVSLVELMIGLAISSMLTLGLIQMFTANQETAKLLRGQALMAESGRFAMEMIGRSLRKAGYRGCNSKRAVETSVANVPYEFDLLRGIQGFDASGATWVPSFTSVKLPTTTGTTDANVYKPNGQSNTGIKVNDLKQGTDMFTVWYVSASEYTVDTGTQALLTGSEGREGGGDDDYRREPKQARASVARKI